MITPDFPLNENIRQKAVEKYQLLDTLPEESYDNITELVAFICKVPVALITLLDYDRNFFKSHHGLEINETPREISFCSHAINSEDEITIIEDARKDKRFSDNPLVTQMQAIFYAGVPLVDPSGNKLGTICVHDYEPRQLNPEQIKTLKAMSKQVVNLFELRYKNFQLTQLQEQLISRNKDLKKFASIVSHDLKSPLANISSMTNLLNMEMNGELSEDAQYYLTHIESASVQLRQYIDGILEFYKSDELIHHRTEHINVAELIQALKEMTFTEEKADLTYECNSENIDINRAAITQILLNLIVNGLKYNSKEERLIHIKITTSPTTNTFEVRDNGDGIPEKFLDKVFDLFSMSGIKDRRGQLGTGVGLATVKKLVENLGGTIKLISKEGEGTTFTFFTVSYKI